MDFSKLYPSFSSHLWWTVKSKAKGEKLNDEKCLPLLDFCQIFSKINFWIEYKMNVGKRFFPASTLYVFLWGLWLKVLLYHYNILEIFLDYAFWRNAFFEWLQISHLAPNFNTFSFYWPSFRHVYWLDKESKWSVEFVLLCSLPFHIVVWKWWNIFLSQVSVNSLAKHCISNFPIA